MRVAVISDVHGNYHALGAVLADIESERVDAVWCLGDTVGYGPRPNECCEAVAERTAVCLVGNHDLVVLGELNLADFNEEAAIAARWTAEILTPRSRRFLEGLWPSGAVDGADLFHASARDPVWEYVLSGESARATLEESDAPLVLVGHSHVPLAYTLEGGEVAGELGEAGTEVDLEGRWLLNPGSVGQPRDGDSRAAWLLLDLDNRFASFRRVQYPIEQTQREMRELGLPKMLAARLAHGE
jgi:predicted phosphodiesterase